MQSLPPRIHGETNCVSLLGSDRPWSVVRTGQLLTGQAYARRKPHFLDLRDLEKPQRSLLQGTFAKLHEPASAIHLLELREPLVFGQGSVVLPDGQLIHDSAREFVNAGRPPEGAVATASGFDLPSREVRRVAGRSLLVKRPWYRNHGHWLVDLMPIVPLCAGSGVEVDTILFGDVPEGRLKDLMRGVASAFCPQARVEFVGDDEQLRCETLFFVEPLHMPPHFKHPRAVQATVDACRIVAGPAAAVAGAPRIYVSRQRAGSRMIEDATALEAMLANEGFVTLFPEELAMAEQIAAFEAADAIVGVKGAGLTNVMFCRPGTRLLVLSPADFPDPFFWDLATQRGLDYAEVFFSGGSAASAAGRANFPVDPARLAPWLRQLAGNAT